MDTFDRDKIRGCLITRSGIPSLDIADQYRYIILDYGPALGLSQSIPLGNMSFCDIGNGLRLVSIRKFNYKLPYSLPKGEKTGYPSGFLGDRAYYFIVTDENFRFLGRVECNFDSLWALEDIRLMFLGENTLQISATDVSPGKDKYRMGVWFFKLVYDGAKLPQRLEISSSCLFPDEKEKNYIPIVGAAGVFITDMYENSYDMITVNTPSRKRKLFCAGMKQYRGSSQLLRYGDGYMALVHRKTRNNYINAFAFFNNDMSVCHYSQEFMVCRNISPINFVCSMSIEKGCAILPFCVNDRWTRLFAIPLKNFEI